MFKALESQLLIELSEAQQALVCGGECTKTEGDNYNLVECSYTTNEESTEKDKGSPTSGFLSPLSSIPGHRGSVLTPRFFPLFI